MCRCAKVRVVAVLAASKMICLTANILCYTVPPTLTFFPSAVRDVVREESLVTSCRASGDPSPMIQWFRGDLLLNAANKYEISISHGSDGITTSSQLTVTGFSSKDAGEYSCVAVNSLGNVTRLFQVDAVGKLCSITSNSL